MLDPDYNPLNDEDDVDNENNEELLDGKYTFSLAENGNTPVEEDEKMGREEKVSMPDRLSLLSRNLTARLGRES